MKECCGQLSGSGMEGRIIKYMSPVKKKHMNIRPGHEWHSVNISKKGISKKGGRSPHAVTLYPQILHVHPTLQSLLYIAPCIIYDMNLYIKYNIHTLWQ